MSRIRLLGSTSRPILVRQTIFSFTVTHFRAKKKLRKAFNFNFVQGS